MGWALPVQLAQIPYSGETPPPTGNRMPPNGVAIPTRSRGRPAPPRCPATLNHCRKSGVTRYTSNGTPSAAKPDTVAVTVKGAINAAADWMPANWPGPLTPDICIPAGPKASIGGIGAEAFHWARLCNNGVCISQTEGFKLASEVKTSTKPGGG